MYVLVACNEKLFISGTSKVVGSQFDQVGSPMEPFFWWNSIKPTRQNNLNQSTTTLEDETGFNLDKWSKLENLDYTYEFQHKV